MARILYIDDDPLTLTLLQKATELLGHEAVIVNSARAALQTIAASNVQLVLVDLNLPDMGGIEFLQATHYTGALPVPPVLVLSASLAAIDENQALAAGAREFIAKPLTIERLNQAVQRWIPEAIE